MDAVDKDREIPPVRRGDGFAMDREGTIIPVTKRPPERLISRSIVTPLEPGEEDGR